MEDFGIFVILGVILRQFHSEHCNYLFGTDYCITHPFLVDPLKHCKKLTEMRKSFEKWKTLYFLSFSMSI